MGGGLLLSDAAARGAAVLGAVFRADQGPGCARPAEVSRREWIRAVGVRRLRLHRAPRAEARSARRAVRQSSETGKLLRLVRQPAAGVGCPANIDSGITLLDKLDL